jgi:hypothetical protein
MGPHLLYTTWKENSIYIYIQRSHESIYPIHGQGAHLLYKIWKIIQKESGVGLLLLLT